MLKAAAVPPQFAPWWQPQEVTSSLALLDQNLRSPWNPYMAADRVTLRIESRARELGADEKQFAAELKESEERLKSLLVVPLLGEREGKVNSGMDGTIIEALSKSHALMRVPAIGNIVGAAQAEFAFATNGKQFDYNNRNTWRFIMLRQRLEDELTDLGVTQRIYNVRPKYQFDPDECPDVSKLMLGDTVQFTMPNGNELRCVLRSGGRIDLASRCPVFTASIEYARERDDGYGPELYPKSALLSRFDPAWKTIEPQHSLGTDLERGLAQCLEAGVPIRPFYFLTWLSKENGKSVLHCVPVPASSIYIFPEDPSELAIHRIIERREAEIADLVSRRGDLFTSVCKDGKVVFLLAEESGVRMELRRLPHEPYFEARYFYGNGDSPSKTLTIQDWIQALEREVGKRGALV